MTRRLVFAIMAPFVLAPTMARGQVCGGSASFAQRPFQVSGAVGFNDNATTFTGGLAFGGSGAFGELSIGTTSFDQVDGSSFNFGGGAGYQVPLGQKGILYLCPTASVAFASGPNDIDVFGDGSLVLDLYETDFSVGLGLGTIASRSGQTQIIPTGSLSFVHATLKGTDQISGASDSQSESFGILAIGVGFVLNETFTLHPGVAIPFGLDGGSTTFGLGFSVNFGQRSQ